MEWWLIAVISFHLFCFCLAISLRHHSNALSVYFFVLLGMAALSQMLNRLGMDSMGEAYFDSHGAMIVLVYSFPLLFNGVVVLLFIIKALIHAMIQAKRNQLKKLN
ncbi:transmembrane protein 18 [Choanephora cucurbitarum]|nr:transmembrane protein 18 [Choanephora cucurbitarum]